MRIALIIGCLAIATAQGSAQTEGCCTVIMSIPKGGVLVREKGTGRTVMVRGDYQVGQVLQEMPSVTLLLPVPDACCEVVSIQPVTAAAPVGIPTVRPVIGWLAHVKRNGQTGGVFRIGGTQLGQVQVGQAVSILGEWALLKAPSDPLKREREPTSIGAGSTPTYLSFKIDG